MNGDSRLLASQVKAALRGTPETAIMPARSAIASYAIPSGALVLAPILANQPGWISLLSGVIAIGSSLPLAWADRRRKAVDREKEVVVKGALARPLNVGQDSAPVPAKRAQGRPAAWLFILKAYIEMRESGLVNDLMTETHVAELIRAKWPKEDGAPSLPSVDTIKQRISAFRRNKISKEHADKLHKFIG